MTKDCCVWDPIYQRQKNNELGSEWRRCCSLDQGRQIHRMIGRVMFTKTLGIAFMGTTNNVLRNVIFQMEEQGLSFGVGPNYRNHKRRLLKGILPIAVSSMMFFLFFLFFLKPKAVGKRAYPTYSKQRSGRGKKSPWWVAVCLP